MYEYMKNCLTIEYRLEYRLKSLRVFFAGRFQSKYVFLIVLIRY